MTGQGWDALVNVVLVGCVAISIVIGLVVAGIAWIFTTGTTALMIGALVPIGFVLWLLYAAIAG